MKIPFLPVLILPLVLAHDLFIKANNKFTPELYKEIAKITTNNVLFSPFSAESVLALAQSGAKGETAEELRKSLHLQNDKTKIQSSIKAALQDIKSSDSYYLRTANKIYIIEDFPIRQSFKDIATEVFGAAAEKINFLNKTEAAKTINSWVQEQTNNKIVDLVTPSVFRTSTKSILINTLYFKADWLSPFRLSFTHKDNFYKSTEDVVLVETMHSVLDQYFNYDESDDINAKFLELPFIEEEEASLTIILPNEKDGLAHLENNLEMVFAPRNFTNQLIKISIPKFKIESKIDLKPILKNLGIKKVFDSNLADLSGIAGEPGDLIIDEVVQKTLIGVNEVGVEAAAATFKLVAVPLAISEIKTFKADHPFIFYVKVKGAIIFAGRITNPIQ